jgi:hypothetical protein
MVDRNRRQRGLDFPVEYDLSAHRIFFRDCDGRDKGHKDASQDPDRIDASIKHAGFPFRQTDDGPVRGPRQHFETKERKEIGIAPHGPRTFQHTRAQNPIAGITEFDRSFPRQSTNSIILVRWAQNQLAAAALPQEQDAGGFTSAFRQARWTTSAKSVLLELPVERPFPDSQEIRRLFAIPSGEREGLTDRLLLESI